VIVIATRRWELGVDPALGGAVTRLQWRGHDVLRPAKSAQPAITETSCYALTPFVNRIANARFTFEGRPIEMDANDDGGRPHALHGQGWRRPWRLDQKKQDRVSLSFTHEPDDWPWAYISRQEIKFDGDSALFSLSVKNMSREPMPASLGYHPYFPRPKGTRLTTRVSGAWRTDAGLIPTHLDTSLDLPFAEGASLDYEKLVDESYPGWGRRAEIEYPDFAVTLSASPEAAFFHLYLPPDDDYFCAEPVTAMPDALNRQDDPSTGLRILAPGESLDLWMRLSARAR
jgi:aldose 1-epimerase